jgi:hypothetical protein
MEEVPTLEGLPALLEPAPLEDRLGEWLVNRGLLRRSQLFDALNVVFRDHCRLGDALVQLGLIDRQSLEREVGWFGASLHRRAGAPPPPPADALRTRRFTPPPLPATRDRLPTPPPIPAARARRATPPPLPARARRMTPSPEGEGPIYLLTRRKPQP